MWTGPFEVSFLGIIADVFQLRRRLCQSRSARRTAAASSVGWQGLKCAAPQSVSDWTEASVDGFASSSSSCFLAKRPHSAARLCWCGRRTFEVAGPWHGRQGERERKGRELVKNLTVKKKKKKSNTDLNSDGMSWLNLTFSPCRRSSEPVEQTVMGKYVLLLFAHRGVKKRSKLLLIRARWTHTRLDLQPERRSQHNRFTNIHTKVLIRPEDHLKQDFIVLNH